MENPAVHILVKTESGDQHMLQGFFGFGFFAKQSFSVTKMFSITGIHREIILSVFHFANTDYIVVPVYQQVNLPPLSSVSRRYR